MKSFWIRHTIPSFLYLFLFLPFFSQAQVNGVVTDGKTGKPISGVEVFLNRTTVGTTSDETGQFTLANITPGFQEIILFKKGYVLYRSSMKIQSDRLYNLQLKLPGNKRKKASPLTHLEKTQLMNSLFGSTTTDSIKIQNIDAIGLATINGQRVLTASTPLIIENYKTGYKQSYYVMELPWEGIVQSLVRFENLFIQEMKQNIAWEKKRQEHFKGSLRHWLMATVAHRLKEEGFVIKAGDGKEVNSQSIISSSSLPGYSKLTIDQPLTIFYKGANGEEVSQVKTSGLVDVNAKGLMINPKAFEVQGDMLKQGLANQLPNDYEPIVGDVEEAYAQTIERFYEKVYVHTDKPYYYPGEPMWFKGYINYKEPQWRDSLSKVMYVELINPEKEVTLTKTLKIDSGLFHNDFILPDTLKEGTYYLRAYTNLNRNFGDSTLFVKQIPILNGTDKAAYTQGKMTTEVSSELVMLSDKQSYKPREKITISLQTKDIQGKQIASNLSLSVTDAIQVVPVEEYKNITNSYSFASAKTKLIELQYPVEYGVSFSGKFVNDKGKPEKTTLDIFQLKPRRMMLAITDEQGFFRQSGLDFYDTVRFSFKSEKAKNFPYGKIELLPREIPAINFKETNHSIAVENTQSPQRIISTYEVPKDTKVLNEVVVKASKIESERPKRSYGYADIVIKSKDINQTNILYTLAQLPGVFVDMMDNRVVFTRSATQSVAFGKGPLVTIDDIPIEGESAGAILTALNPANIESIEVTKRLNPLYGTQGMAGVIAVYLKKGFEVENDEVAPNFQLLTIRGYSPERKFLHPDYSDPQTDATLADYRSTIYWNPEVTTQPKATFSFFAADLPGKYRIVAEGVLENGKPVRSVSFITIENDN